MGFYHGGLNVDVISSNLKFVFLGGSPILPFLPVIVKQMGMSGSAMGFILALNQIISLLAR